MILNSNGLELCTREVQKVINDAKDGEVIFFSKGKYVLSTVFLKRLTAKTG